MTLPITNYDIKLTIPFLRWFYPKIPNDYEIHYAGQNFIPEVLLVAVLLASAHSWSQGLQSANGIISFGLWAIILVLLFSLALANTKTMLLPNRLVYPLGATIVIYQIFNAIHLGSGKLLLSAFIGCLLLGGIPYLLFQISSGRWIGGGDVKLGFYAGILLGWKLSLVLVGLVTLFSLITLIVVKSSSKVHMPALIPTGVLWAGSIIVCVLIGQHVSSLFI